MNVLYQQVSITTKIKALSSRVKHNPNQFKTISIKLVDKIISYLKLDVSVRNIHDERTVYILLMMYSLILKDYGLFTRILRNYSRIDEILSSINRFIIEKDLSRIIESLPAPNNERIFEVFVEYYQEIQQKLQQRDVITTSMLLINNTELSSSFAYAINEVYYEIHLEQINNEN